MVSDEESRPFRQTIFVLHSSAAAISNNQYIYSVGIVVHSPVLLCDKDIMDYFFWDLIPSPSLRPGI